MVEACRLRQGPALFTRLGSAGSFLPAGGIFPGAYFSVQPPYFLEIFRKKYFFYITFSRQTFATPYTRTESETRPDTPDHPSLAPLNQTDTRWLALWSHPCLPAVPQSTQGA